MKRKKLNRFYSFVNNKNTFDKVIIDILIQSSIMVIQFRLDSIQFNLNFIYFIAANQFLDYRKVE